MQSKVTSQKLKRNTLHAEGNEYVDLISRENTFWVSDADGGDSIQ